MSNLKLLMGEESKLKWSVRYVYMTTNLLLVLSFPTMANLRIAYIDAPPYAFLDEDNIESGLLIDSFREIAQHLEIQAEFVHLPHRRKIDFIEKRKVDLWAGQIDSKVNNELFLVSKTPLFLMELKVYWKHGTQKVTSIDDLYDKNLILISSFSYGGNHIRLNEESRSVTHAINHEDAFNKLFSANNRYLLGYSAISKATIEKFQIGNIQEASLSKYQLHLKLSKTYPNAPKIMQKIDAFLLSKSQQEP